MEHRHNRHAVVAILGAFALIGVAEVAHHYFADRGRGNDVQRCLLDKNMMGLGAQIESVTKMQTAWPEHGFMAVVSKPNHARLQIGSGVFAGKSEVTDADAQEAFSICEDYAYSRGDTAEETRQRFTQLRARRGNGLWL